MAGYIEGISRDQVTLFPDRLEDWIDEDHPVRVIDAFGDAMDLVGAGFGRMSPAQTGRPCYHPSVLLKLFIYGYLNRIPSSRRLEREAGRKFKAVNNRDRNFTSAKIELRISHLEASASRYLEEMGTRASDRGHVLSNGREPSSDAHPTVHGRASVRHHQGVDGFDPFSDAQTEQRPDENGAARACLQHQTDSQYDWRKSTIKSNNRLRELPNTPSSAPNPSTYPHQDRL